LTCLSYLFRHNVGPFDIFWVTRSLLLMLNETIEDESGLLIAYLALMRTELMFL